MRKLLIAGAVAAVAVAAPAAAQSITFVNGVYSSPLGINLTTFEEFEGGVIGAQYNPATQSAGVRPQTVSGNVNAEIIQGNATPFNPDFDGNKYLAVQSGGALNVALATGTTVFSFVFGTLDTYNQLQLFFSNGTSRTFTGREIIGLPNNQTNPSTYAGVTGRVTYDIGSGPTLTSASFSSVGFNAFEIDGLASAVPEPATWGLMMLGFGMIGGQLRSRRRTKTTVSFA